MFFFGLTWSVGGSCSDDGRVLMDKLLKELISVSRHYDTLNLYPKDKEKMWFQEDLVVTGKNLQRLLCILLN